MTQGSHLGDALSPVTSPNSSFLVSSFPFSKNAILTRAARGQVGVQSDPGGLSPESQGFRSTLLALLAWPWEAESGCVYPAGHFRSRWAPVSAASQELG